MTEEKTEKSRHFFGIFPRAVLLSLTGVVLALVAFAITIVKREQRLLLENLESRAELMAASVDRVSANAIVAEEQWSVVEQFQKLVEVSSEVRYAVVTKQADGDSLIFTKDGWLQSNLTDEFWHPIEREKHSQIYQGTIVDDEVLHFRYPFSYEGYDWGWIHVGMGLDEYRKSLAGIYRIVVFLAIPGLVIGLFLSFLFARRLTRPISKLQMFARRLASGDLDQRVELATRDELGDLAESLNRMAGELGESMKRESELREKEILLKEIHHRVKNNMQILTSLLRLQSRKLPDESMRAIMRESESRIRSMGLIHEKLYQSNSLSEIDFAGYARTLTGEIRRMYSKTNGGVELKVEADNIRLGLDTALPCGLIINELVSNSLKYAFPDGQKGSITIKLLPLEDDEYELVVSDDGIGIPEGGKLEREGSLGMRLVSMLVEQLNGELQTSNGVGITSTIHFRESQYTQRL